MEQPKKLSMIELLRRIGKDMFLKEIRNFDGSLWLVFSFGPRFGLGTDLCANLGEFKKTNMFVFGKLPDKPYDSLLCLIKTVFPNIGGYLDQSWKVIFVILQHFFIKKKNCDIVFRPLELAVVMLKVHNLIPEKHFIVREFIDAYYIDHIELLDKKTNLDATELQMCKNVAAKWEKGGSGKNSSLVEHLKNFPIQSDSFYSLIAENFTKSCQASVREAVDGVFGFDVIQHADCKSEYRIKQKYDEYCNGYLTPGIHVFKKFKDLFRASISYDNFIVHKHKFAELKDGEVDIVSFKSRDEGNYRAFYITLNVKSWNFELKVVKDLENVPESHDWYELRRNSSMQNLETFIRRRIDAIKPDFLTSDEALKNIKEEVKVMD